MLLVAPPRLRGYQIMSLQSRSCYSPAYFVDTPRSDSSRFMSLTATEVLIWLPDSTCTHLCCKRHRSGRLRAVILRRCSNLCIKPASVVPNQADSHTSLKNTFFMSCSCCSLMIGPCLAWNLVISHAIAPPPLFLRALLRSESYGAFGTLKLRALLDKSLQS